MTLRKSSTDEEVVTLAKTLIKTWKKFVPDNQDKKDRKGKDEKSRKEDEDGKKSALDTDFKAAKEIGAKSFPSRSGKKKIRSKLSVLEEETKFREHILK